MFREYASDFAVMRRIETGQNIERNNITLDVLDPVFRFGYLAMFRAGPPLAQAHRDAIARLACL
jgi:hypothetical protein